MAKRRLKKVPKAADLTHAAERLRKALVGNRTKDELVDVSGGTRTERITSSSGDSMRGLNWEASDLKELVAATRQAISDATDFDEREINYNFDYDYEAYSEVKRNLGRLIDQGHLRQAMELSLEVRKEGSCQVEMSDEGLMTPDIEECFSVVVKALKKCDLPPSEVITWCEAMSKSDRVGFIYERELQGLRKSFRGVAVVRSRLLPERGIASHPASRLRQRPRNHMPPPANGSDVPGGWPFVAANGSASPPTRPLLRAMNHPSLPVCAKCNGHADSEIRATPGRFRRKDSGVVCQGDEHTRHPRAGENALQRGVVADVDLQRDRCRGRRSHGLAVAAAGAGLADRLLRRHRGACAGHQRPCFAAYDLRGPGREPEWEEGIAWPVARRKRRGQVLAPGADGPKEPRPERHLRGLRRRPGRFPEAIRAAYPQTKVQLCVVHLVRAALRYVSTEDSQAVTLAAAVEIKKVV